jgi:hypothetical protein
MSEGEYLRANMFSNMDVEAAKKMIENYTEFPEDIFAAMEAYYNNPSAVNYEAAEQALSDWTADSSLLTYSELVALGTHEAILAELNTNNEGYYASLTAE